MTHTYVMGLMSWFTERRSEKRGLNFDPVLLEAMKQQGTAGVPVNDRSVLSLPQLYRACSIVSSKAASLPPCVYRKQDGRKKPVPNHPAEYLLNVRLNNLYSCHRGLSTLYFDALLHGNGYAYLQRSEAGVVERWYNLSPTNMILRYGVPEGGQPEGWYYQTFVYKNAKGEYWSPVYVPSPEQAYGSSTVMLYMPCEDVFVLRSAVGTALAGYSAVTLMSAAYGEAVALQEFSNSFFSNGLTTSCALEIPDSTGVNWKKPDEVRQFRECIEGVHSGSPRKANRMLMLLGGTKVSGNLGLSAKDAQVIEARRFSVDQISAATGCPSYLLSNSENTSQFGNIEARSNDFLAYTIGGWLDSFASEAEMKLLTEAEKDSGEYCVDFDRKVLIQLDQKTSRDVLWGDYDHGLLSKDEARAELGRDALPEQEEKPEGDLKSTVGGVQAILALQTAVYNGSIPAAAAKMNCVKVFGFSEADASALFPQVEPVKTSDTGVVPPPPGQPEVPEEGKEDDQEEAPDPLQRVKDQTVDRIVKRLAKSVQRRVRDDFVEQHHDVLLDAFAPLTKDADVLVDDLLPALAEELRASLPEQYETIFRRVKHELRIQI